MKPKGPRSPHEALADEALADDEAFSRLSQLPDIEPDVAWSKRVQALARAGVTNASFVRRVPARMTWSARLVAAALACGSVLYLRWAVEAAAALYR